MLFEAFYCVHVYLDQFIRVISVIFTETDVDQEQLDIKTPVLSTSFGIPPLISWYLKVPGDLPGSGQASSSHTNHHKGILTPEEQ